MRYVLISFLLSFSAFAEESLAAQVVVHLPNGTKMRGERIVPVGADTYILEVYRGFSQKIPKSTVQRIEESPEIAGAPPTSPSSPSILRPANSVTRTAPSRSRRQPASASAPRVNRAVSLN